MTFIVVLLESCARFAWSGRWRCPSARHGPAWPGMARHGPGGGRPPPAPHDSALGLVDRACSGAVDVLLGDHREAGLHGLRDGGAVQRGDGCIHAVLADVGGRLSDQRLDGSVLQSIDLVGPRVKTNYVDLALLARLAKPPGSALGGE